MIFIIKTMREYGFIKNNFNLRNNKHCLNRNEENTKNLLVFSFKCVVNKLSGDFW